MPEIDFLEQGVVFLFSPIEAVGLSQIVMLQKGSDGHPAATLRHAFWPDRVPWGRSGEEFTDEDMQHCGWLKPHLVESIEFLEWTAEKRLRHAKFVALRDDKIPRQG